MEHFSLTEEEEEGKEDKEDEEVEGSEEGREEGREEVDEEDNCVTSLSFETVLLIFKSI